jgi:hypothetical protein
MDTLREGFRPWDVALALFDAAFWLFGTPPLKKALNPRLLLRWSDRHGDWR